MHRIAALIWMIVDDISEGRFAAAERNLETLLQGND